MSLTSTADHVTIAREWHELTLDTQQRKWIAVTVNQFFLAAL